MQLHVFEVWQIRSPIFEDGFPSPNKEIVGTNVQLDKFGGLIGECKQFIPSGLESHQPQER